MRPHGRNPISAQFRRQQEQIEAGAAAAAPGVLRMQTTRGLITRPAGPGIELPLREMDVCVELADGTTKKGFVYLRCTEVFFRDENGRVTDIDGNLI